MLGIDQGRRRVGERSRNSFLVGAGLVTASRVGSPTFLSYSLISWPPGEIQGQVHFDLGQTLPKLVMFLFTKFFNVFFLDSVRDKFA